MKSKVLYLSLASLFFVNSAKISHAQTGCPYVSVGPDQSTNCNNPCTTLSATYLQTGATTSYSVSSIPYNPPYPFNVGTPVSVNTDDVWSGIIPMTFNFCFFGNSYNQCVVGSNGVISFNTSLANGFCPWSFAASVPSNALPINAIFGAYHDINPAVCGSLRYAVLGSAPCRTFVFNFDAVCHFSCTNLTTTQQIVLYETTNAIDVYIQNKPTCSSWNNGNAVIGVQNATGTVGYTPTGRNTGSWITTNEAWRFTPSGPPNQSIAWYDANLNVVGTSPTIQVCPSDTTTYIAEVTYLNCDSSVIKVYDTVIVNSSNPINTSVTQNNITCNGDTNGSATVIVTGGSMPYTYLWTPTNSTSPSINNLSAGNYICTITDAAGCSTAVNVAITEPLAITPSFTVIDTPCVGNTDGELVVNVVGGYPPYTFLWNTTSTNDTLSNISAGTYIITITDSANCTSQDTITITANPLPNITISSNEPLCEGDNLILNALGGNTYQWSGPGGFTSSQQNPTINNATLADTGIYKVVVANSFGCIDSATYTANIYPHPAINFFTDTTVCEGETLFIRVTGANQYQWAGPNNLTSLNDTIIIPNATQQHEGDYIVLATDTNGCQTLDTMHITVLPTPNINASGNSPVCEGDSIKLSATGSGNYSWTGPDNFTSNLQNPTLFAKLTSEGAYFASFTNTQGCTGADSIYIDVIPLPIANLGPDTAICEQGIVLTPDTLYPGIIYSWSTGETTDSINVSTPGIYTVTVTTNCGTATDTIEVSLIGGPVAIMNDTLINCNQDAIILDAQNPGAVYFWQNTGDTTQLLEVSEQGTYTVEITRCQQTVIDSAFVQKLTKVVLTLPNLFSPNGDGINEQYFLLGSNTGITEFRAQIFNRWGNSLYKSDKPDFKWNGTTYTNVAANAGVYYLVVEYKDECSDGKTTKKTSTIQIVR